MSNLSATSLPILQIGKIKNDRFWIQCLDGRMLQIDTESKEVLKRLAANEDIHTISERLEIEEEDIRALIELLGLNEHSSFSILDRTEKEHLPNPTVSFESYEKDLFFNPWLEKHWFTYAVLIALAVSIGSTILFMTKTPLLFMSGLKEQWILAGFLTLSVIIHEVGHLLAMPRHRNISISVQWSGPIPLLSIICNEAWKLSKWQRMRINTAGFVADVIVCGVAAALGLWAEALSPWIWTFTFIHMIRMIFALCPFLPGDGYWILVDLFDHPNLWANAMTQLYQRKLTWLSMYAMGRRIFTGLIWLLYGYMLYFWATALFGRPIEDILSFLLYPAPLLISLNVVYMLGYMIMLALRLLKGVRKA